MSDWNPELYLKFQKERTQPVYDLISRMEIENPKRILDIGCGPGNSTIVLKDRWPEAQVIGLDYSEAMIEKSKKDYPDIRFIVGDANRDLSYLGDFDIVFANASLQWLPHHETLIPRLFNMVNPNGIFAAQIPQFDKMPIAHIIEDVAASPKWASHFVDFKTGMTFYSDGSYYDFVFDKSSCISMWATEYYHVMNSHHNIIDMIKSTGMKPYLDKLPKELVSDFLDSVLHGLKAAYPSQNDNRVLFPFKRFFMVANHQ